MEVKLSFAVLCCYILRGLITCFPSSLHFKLYVQLTSEMHKSLSSCLLDKSVVNDFGVNVDLDPRILIFVC